MKTKSYLKLKERPAATVNLIGGRLCLDFINTIGARRTKPSGEMYIRDEKLNDYFDLIAWAEHAGVFNGGEVRALEKLALVRPRQARDTLRAALRLREALYGIFKSILLKRRPEPENIDVLNDWLRAARSALEIRSHRFGFRWQWGKPKISLERILWLVCESAGQLLTEGDLSRLRQCGGDDCGWIFEDRTRNRSRHWCDTRDCGNRDRVRRFRRKHEPTGEL
ncbi:MAG TPA: ABATE domain-containing protein [Candidatus Sulfotelmatobacter sp.]|nr:ABATE domain-containing protein [Candidatus Sulfotelmatobacter sp.]